MKTFMSLCLRLGFVVGLIATALFGTVAPAQAANPPICGNTPMDSYVMLCLLGDSLTDASGKSTLQQTSAASVQSIGGRTALYFGGSSGLSLLAYNNSGWQLPQVFTLETEAYITSDNGSPNRQLFGIASGATTWQLTVPQNQNPFFGMPNAASLSFNNAFPWGRWVNLAVTRDSTNTVRFFIDGELVRQVVNTLPIQAANPSAALGIGGVWPQSGSAGQPMYLRNLVISYGIARHLTDYATGTGNALPSWNLRYDSQNFGNPDLAWSYGSEPTVGGAFTPFNTKTTGVSAGNNIATWNSTALGSSGPSIIKTVAPGASGISSVPVGQVALRPASNLVPAVVRWTAPISAQVQVSGNFGVGMVGFRVNDNILHNGSSIFNYSSSSFGYFNISVAVNAGDTLDFVVGGQYMVATTPLDVTIVPTSSLAPQASAVCTQPNGTTPATATQFNNTLWTFSYGNGSLLANALTLLPNGQIGGYSDPNEDHWGIYNGMLAFYNASNQVTGCFNQSTTVASQQILSGPDLADAQYTLLLSQAQGASGSASSTPTQFCGLAPIDSYMKICLLGNSLTDATGQSSLTQTSAAVVQSIGGHTGLYFDGSNGSKLLASNPGGWSLPQVFTWEVQAYIPSSAKTQPLQQLFGIWGGPNAWQLSIANAQAPFVTLPNETSNTVFGVTYPTDSWVSLAVTRDSTDTLRFFVNGQLVKSVSDSSEIVLAPSVLLGIGGVSPQSGQEGQPKYLRNLELSFGIARYTTSYNAPNLAPPAGASTSLDAPVQNNPGSAWDYGWEPTVGGVFTPYTYFPPTSTDVSPGWYDVNLGITNGPHAWRNETQTTLFGAMPGQLALHPGSNGEVSIMRWTAAVSQQYHLTGSFDVGDAGEQVYTILHNNQVIYSAPLTYAAGVFDLHVYLNQGDTLDFAVSGNWLFGDTPVDVTIEPDTFVYGWQGTPGSSFAPFDVTPAVSGGAVWYPSSTGLADGPHAWINTSNTTLYGAAPGQTALHPGSNGQTAVMRWVAPYTEQVQINAEFFAGDIGIENYSILHNGQSVYSVIGSAGNATYSGVMSINQGDSIDMVVGGAWLYGDTPVSLQITPVANTPVVVSQCLANNSSITAAQLNNTTWNFSTTDGQLLASSLTFTADNHFTGYYSTNADHWGIYQGHLAIYDASNNITSCFVNSRQSNGALVLTGPDLLNSDTTLKLSFLQNAVICGQTNAGATVANLTNTSWILSSSGGDVLANNLTLLANGAVGGFSSPDEDHWGVYNGQLAFYNAKNSMTSCYPTDTAVANNGAQLQGPYLLGPGTTYTLTTVPAVASGGGTTVNSLPTHVSQVSISRVFDAQGRLLSQTDGVGNTTQYAYDGNGNQTSVQDALGHTTQYQYDVLNRKTTIIDPANGQTVLGYDDGDRLTSVTDPNGHITRYSYNGLDARVQTVSPDTGTTSYQLSDVSTVLAQTDARGVTANYQYDALNRLLSSNYGDETLGYSYDQGNNGIGHLTSVSDSSGGTLFNYDIHSRITQVQRTVAGIALNTVNQFDATSGLLTSVTMPSGAQVQYTWNNGAISGITVNGQTLLTNITYRANGQPLSWTWGNGTTHIMPGDAAGRVAGYTLADTSYALTYDSDSNITHIADGSSSGQSYGYDGLNRLINANVGGSNYGYNYDANGNRTAKVSGTNSTQYTVDPQSNRLLATQGSDLSQNRTDQFDSAGNLLSDGRITMAYNNRGRMKSATVGGQTWQYVYNALGQRVEKIGPTATTLFVYDQAGHLTGEYDQTGKLIEETIWLGDTPIAVLQPSSGGSKLYYVHADHLGAPREVSDPMTNTVVWSWVQTEPFGVGAANSDPDNNGVAFTYNLRFPGQYFDAEAGRSYNYFRDYDPQTGRYVESDPTGLMGGLNTYAYAAENPALYQDPSGKDPIIGATVGLIAGAIQGYLGAASQGGSLGEDITAAIIGALLGGAIGALDPSLGVATLSIIGATAGGVGDALGQEIAIYEAKEDGKCKDFNWGSNIASIIAGGLGGWAGVALAPWAEIMGEWTATTVANVLLTPVTVAIPIIGGNVYDHAHQ